MLGEKNRRRIDKIQLEGGASNWDDIGFLKTIRHAKGSNLKYIRMVKEKSGPCTSYVDLSLKRKKIKERE